MSHLQLLKSIVLFKKFLLWFHRNQTFPSKVIWANYIIIYYILATEVYDIHKSWDCINEKLYPAKNIKKQVEDDNFRSWNIMHIQLMGKAGYLSLMYWQSTETWEQAFLKSTWISKYVDMGYIWLSTLSTSILTCISTHAPSHSHLHTPPLSFSPVSTMRIVEMQSKGFCFESVIRFLSCLSAEMWPGKLQRRASDLFCLLFLVMGSLIELPIHRQEESVLN